MLVAWFSPNQGYENITWVNKYIFWQKPPVDSPFKDENSSQVKCTFKITQWVCGEKRISQD